MMLGGETKEKVKYIPKRDKNTNFNAIKKYGEKLYGFFYSNVEKLNKLNSGDQSELSSLIRRVTALYSSIAKYSSLSDLQSKDKVKSEDEDLFNEYDKVVTNYEKEETNI